MGQPKLRADDMRADLINQDAVGVLWKGHTPTYQRGVETARALSLIARARAILVNRSVMKLGERIEAAYVAKGLNQRQAAERLHWSAQRLHNYVNGRNPDLDSLMRIAEAFDTTPNELLGLNEESGSELLDILRRLLELEGLPAHRAGTIAEAAIAAQRLLRSLPGGGSPDRPAIAAQAIWSARSDSETDKSPRP